MLATLARKPLDIPGWVYEEKYDGYRILAYKEGGHVALLSRNAKDRTETFSAVAEAVAALPARTLLLDGEVVAFDRRGVSRFQLLQELKSEPQYAVFDCLYRDGLDLRAEPLTVRRAALAKVVSKTAKQDATIDHGKPRYVGKVGTGFTQESLTSLFRAFQPLVTTKPSVVDPPNEKHVTHLIPRLVAQIAFEEWTADHKLRQPVFLGLRDDKRPRDVTVPEAK